MITIRQERPADAGQREALLGVAYGPARFTKTSARLRERRLPADSLSFVAVNRGRVVGSVRLWHISLGGDRSALLLGPLAVHPEHRKSGIGSALVQRAIRDATSRGHGAVLLVGDASYYDRFGFSAEKTGAIWMPGFCDPRRLLALELIPDALEGVQGLVTARGNPEPRPKLAKFIESLRARTSSRVQRRLNKFALQD